MRQQVARQGVAPAKGRIRTRQGIAEQHRLLGVLAVQPVCTVTRARAGDAASKQREKRIGWPGRGRAKPHLLLIFSPCFSAMSAAMVGQGLSALLREGKVPRSHAGEWASDTSDMVPPRLLDAEAVRRGDDADVAHLAVLPRIKAAMHGVTHGNGSGRARWGAASWRREGVGKEEGKRRHWPRTPRRWNRHRPLFGSCERGRCLPARRHAAWGARRVSASVGAALLMRQRTGWPLSSLTASSRLIRPQFHLGKAQRVSNRERERERERETETESDQEHGPYTCELKSSSSSPRPGKPREAAPKSRQGGGV